MPITRTTTATRSFTRVDLMKLQIERVLYRCRIEERSTQKILTAIDNQWIAELSLYGLDISDVCHVELYMAIDWARNKLHVAAGRNTISIDDRWRDGVAIEVEKTLALFDELCTERELSVLLHIRYRPGLDFQSINRSLGFAPAGPVHWRSGEVGSTMSPPELDEFTIGVRITE